MTKIARVDTFLLESPLERPFGWSQGWIDRRSTGLVKLTTDDGLVGWGEGLSGPGDAVVRDVLAPILLGRDPMARNGLWQELFGALYNANLAVGYGGSALSAVDTALWDLAGHAASLPVYDLLGGRVRDRVAVYATGLYYTAGEFPDRLLAEAVGYVEAGFLGMKTKVGGLPLAEDVKRVAAIRAAIGPDVQLAVDANQAYNAAAAIRLGQRVKAALPMAIAGGEVLRTRFEFREFLTRNAFDIAQPDVVNVGGITELQRVAAMANACGILVNPHVWGSPVMIAATLHLAATLPSCPRARAPQPFVQEPVMEFDRTPSALREELCERPFDQEGGYVAVPAGPGLGIQVNEQVLARLTVRHATYK